MQAISTRNLTKFLVPMVDVMTLLFSVFLLMPIVEEKQKEEKYQGNDPESIHKEEMKTLRDELEKRMTELEDLRQDRKTELQYERLRKQVAELKKEQVDRLSERVSVFIIDVAFKKGNAILTYTEPGPNHEPKVLDREDKVNQLIKTHRTFLKDTQKEPYYLFRGPPSIKGLPLTGSEAERYKKWFASVSNSLG